MFTPQADSIVTEMRQKAVLTANQRRKDDAEKKLSYFNDEFEPYISEKIAEIYKDSVKISPVSVNVVRKVVKSLATTYIQDCVRSIDGTAQDQKIFAEIEDVASLPVKLKAASHLVKLLGTILIRVVWRNGKPALDLLTPDVLDVVTGDSPEDVLAVLITQHADSGKHSEVQYALWTAAEVSRLDYRFQTIQSEPNPYHCLPFVPVWSSPPLDSFWLPGLNSLVSAQDAINERLIDLWHTLRFQSFGVGYISGAKLPGARPGQTSTELALGPNTTVILPENGKVGFVSPDAPVAETLQAIDQLMKWTAVSHGLPAASVSTDPVEESGIAKIVGNSELSEMRADDIAQFARVEQQLFDIFRTVWNTHRPQQQISTAATMRTDFYDPQPVVSAAEQVKEWAALLELGLISPVDILIQRNPDLSRDDAKAEILRIRDENKEFQQNIV